jgi:hypothetical protein
MQTREDHVTTRHHRWQQLFLPAVVLAVSIAVPLDGSAQLCQEDIDELQAAIDEQGLEWTAGRTSMTDKSLGEIQSMLMPPLAELGVPDLDGVETAGTRADREPPALAPRPDPDDPVFTWQDVNGQDWTSPVTNQGQCGSCAIFAAGSTLEAVLNVAFGDPDLDYDLAEQYFLDCTPASCAEGTHHLVCFNQALHYGVPDEACMPYMAADQDCADLCDDADQRMVYASGWGWIADYLLDAPTEEQIKEAVAIAPVTTSMDVYSDYFGYVDGVYEPAEGMPVVGSHAVPIIGWNDEHDSWYCKNSWGTDWGQAGYFEIRREAAGIGGPFSTWLAMDATGIQGSFDLTHDEVEALLEHGVGDAETKVVSIFRTAGDGDVPFWISLQYDAEWLEVVPMSGVVGADDVALTFTFDESKYTQNPGSVSLLVEVLGGHGLARVVEARIVVMPGDGIPDDTDTGPAPTPDAGADGGSDGGDEGCNCAAAGVASRRPGLVAALAGLLAEGR